MMNYAWLDLLFIDLNPVGLKYYPFMIILDKYSGSCVQNVLQKKQNRYTPKHLM